MAAMLDWNRQGVIDLLEANADWAGHFGGPGDVGNARRTLRRDDFQTNGLNATDKRLLYTGGTLEPVAIIAFSEMRPAPEAPNLGVLEDMEVWALASLQNPLCYAILQDARIIMRRVLHQRQIPGVVNAIPAFSRWVFGIPEGRSQFLQEAGHVMARFVIRYAPETHEGPGS